MSEATPLVGIIMGSKSDWPIMSRTAKLLSEFEVPHECRVLSAHRTPAETSRFVTEAAGRGIKVIIAGAGGAAHLAGVAAAHTVIPVLGVPIPSSDLQGLDALLATVQMPGGIPVGTLAVGKAGADNAALLAISILGTSDPSLLEKIEAYRKRRADKVLSETLP